ncbi:MAG TPA: zinc-binding protein, partial [Ruminococcus sp.]|nr:zinc-binding protein [Ruminococcus sp.]
VNLENTNTIEFRIFKGTLNINTFLAAIQFVVTISSFAKKIKLADIPFTSWRDIFMPSTYPELNNYLKIKELI